MKQILAIVMVLGVLATTAMAEDLFPPSWRGQPNTTSEVWGFGSPIQPTPPDGPALGGLPPLPNTMTYVDGGSWVDTYLGRQGMWDLSGVNTFMDVWVTNYPNPNEVKKVQVQITWTWDGTTAGPLIGNINPPPSLPPGPRIDHPLGGGWTESTYYFEIRPNPAQEQFFIFGDARIDSLVVDTWCVPEPSTFVLLATSGLGVLVCAWRRRRS